MKFPFNLFSLVSDLLSLLSVLTSFWIIFFLELFHFRPHTHDSHEDEL